jgi:hypothetical protein
LRRFSHVAGVIQRILGRTGDAQDFQATYGGRTLAAPFVLLSARHAFALDRIKFGKSVPNSFAFSTAEIGIDARFGRRKASNLLCRRFVAMPRCSRP